ncbi:hypothetical protein [Nocardia sp. NPDC050435]|uniref:hypothetical protein n=1 Tax=Nocardia sp. NPDC050435 TaxID=3155040 RepID=UPI0033F5A3C0
MMHDEHLDLEDELAFLDRIERAVAGLKPEHQREVWQFAAWAAAAGRPVLPTDAATTLAYLDAYPGTLETQRGRVTALNAVHAARKLPEPGTAESVRRVLNPGHPARAATATRPALPAREPRAVRLARMYAHADDVISRFPVTGWLTALGGRRDAVILLLAAGGMSWAEIAGLRQGEVTVTAEAVTIGALPMLELPATGQPASCPVAVFSRWSAVLVHAPAAAGHIVLQQLLTAPEAELPGAPLSPPGSYADQPLLCDFDINGLALGFIGELDPLPRTEIAAIVAGHMLAQPEPGDGPDLPADSYERGIAARWRTKEIGDDIEALWERFDALAAQYGV